VPEGDTRAGTDQVTPSSVDYRRGGRGMVREGKKERDGEEERKGGEGREGQVRGRTKEEREGRDR